MDTKAMLNTLGIDLQELFSGKNLGKILIATAIIIIVLLAFQLLLFGMRRVLKGRATEQTTMLAGKAIRYTSFVVVALIIFNRLGVDLSAFLGAAGIAGIAIGFAAQTSMSNVISGLFLVSEKPFAIGDVITVGDITGSLLSIDLFSIKIQTFDNRYVRIPNETIIKSNVVNVTRYPIRRMDITIIISYSDDLERALDVLVETAHNNVLVLDNPETFVLVDRFDEKGVVVILGLWFLQSDYLDLRNSIMKDIRKAFTSGGFGVPTSRIEISGSVSGAPQAGTARKGG
jgi:small-conductance mechanosensitive channel